MKRLMLAGLLVLSAMAASAEQVLVSDCERDAGVDYWAANDVEFCCRIMNEVFAMAGIEPVRSGFDADGMFSVSNAEVICSAFRTPNLLKNYEFPLQPLGRMHYALYTTHDRAELMMSMKITDWPRIKVAYSPVSQGRDDDRINYFRHANLSPEYVEYRTSVGAVDALKKGEVDVLFLYTPYGKRPDGLVEIVPIGMRNIYFAVRKDKPDLLNRLTGAYREWYINNIERYDAWREELLGIAPPVKRVRIAAYSRGDLFSVTPDGVRSGLIEEWVRSLCAITHWTPDYVYGDYDQSLEDVKNGRLDLIGGLGFAANRNKYYHYPHTPIGMLRVYLWTHRDSPYEAGKPQTWSNMKIGLLSGALSANRVKQHLKEMDNDEGITVREYPSDCELKKAYFSGEVDACVDIEMSELANERALRIYASHPMYLVASQHSKGLFDELENALDVVVDDFPKYMRMMSERHYGSHSELSELSVKEMNWLTERLKDPTPITIDFSPWPFRIHDDTGRITGLPKMLLDEITRKTGLKFKVSPQTGIQTSEAKFLRGDTQFWIPYPERPDSAVYGATSVFSLAVPHSCSELYGVKDFRTEFEMFTSRDTAPELVSILRKTVTGLEPMYFQELFMAAAATRMADRKFFGLSESELKEYVFTIGGTIAFFVVIYSVIMAVLLKRQAHRAEEAAHVAQEFAQAKTRFLAMMSHELRTPLNAVIGFAEFLAKDQNSEHRKEYVDGILKSATALLELINDILDFSKIEAGAMNMREDKCDVEKIIGELPAIFGYRVRQHGVTLDVHRAPDSVRIPVLKLSRQGLRQVLLNIVGNSAKFTEKGKIVVEYGWRPRNNMLQIKIYDTGRGISKEKMSKLFDPFQQDIKSRMNDACGDETKGTGLGLPIVKRLIDGADGTIEVKSSIGQGTHFLIEIPNLEVVEEAPQPADAKPVKEASGNFEMPKRILVVDDMIMNRKILGIHLANLGAKDIRFAENGKVALEAMKEWLPDVVLTDMWMPEMDGAVLADTMKADARLKKVKVVAVTADVDVDSTYDMRLFLKVIAKPVTGDKLRQLFEEI